MKIVFTYKFKFFDYRGHYDTKIRNGSKTEG